MRQSLSADLDYLKVVDNPIMLCKLEESHCRVSFDGSMAINAPKPLE